MARTAWATALCDYGASTSDSHSPLIRRTHFPLLAWRVWCTVNSSNGPLGRVSYPEYGVQTAHCPFVCLNPSLYANEAYNACIPTPIYQWTSGGTRNSPTSCNGTVVYQAGHRSTQRPPLDGRTQRHPIHTSGNRPLVRAISTLMDLSLNSLFRLWVQMWIDWEDTYQPGDANSSAAGVGYGLLGVAPVWRWYLQRMADGHSR